MESCDRNKEFLDNILVHNDERGNELCRGNCPLILTITEGRIHGEDNIYLHHKDGRCVPVSAGVSPIRDRDGRVIGIIEVFEKNTAKGADACFIDDLRKAALLDPLTNLPNRRYIEMKIASSSEGLKRHGIPFGILFADIDLFKAINDTYGHDIGDRVLRMVAGTLENNVRAYDAVGRWGGEEFIAVINHTDEEQLKATAEKLRSLVEESFLSAGDTSISVTVTIGVALARPDDTMESIIKRADRALYKGKSHGRNRVIMEEDDG